jgi:hypothetical protein
MCAYLTAATLGVVAGGLWFAWRRYAGRIGNQFDRVTTIAAVTPYCARLEPVARAEWADESTADALTHGLQTEGFELIGDFVTKPEGALLRALTLPARSVYAIIQQLHIQPVALELLTPYTDGRFVSFTDGQPARWPDPPAHTVTCDRGAGPKELVARLLRDRPAGDLEATAADQFVATYLRARRQAMAWMLQRGGPTDDEIRAYLTEFPVRAAMDVLMNLTRKQWQTALGAALQDQLREQYVALHGDADLEGKPHAGRLVFVHDGMTANELMDLIDEAEDDPEDDADDDALDANSFDMENAVYQAGLRRTERLLAGSTPRAVFPQLNGQLSPKLQLTKIGELEQPLAADVYLRHRVPQSMEMLGR